MSAVCEYSFSRCLYTCDPLLVVFPHCGYRIMPTRNQKSGTSHTHCLPPTALSNLPGGRAVVPWPRERGSGLEGSLVSSRAGTIAPTFKCTTCTTIKQKKGHWSIPNGPLLPPQINHDCRLQADIGPLLATLCAQQRHDPRHFSFAHPRTRRPFP